MSPVSEPVRIGIIGDFNPEFRSHQATNDALQHAAHKLATKVESAWVPTPSLLEAGADAVLDSFDGLWASAGSPYKSFDGMLRGIEFARVHDKPFLATCGGFQYTMIECARNVLGIHDATTAEEDPKAKNIIIYPVACAVPNRAPNAPKLSGQVPQIGSMTTHLMLESTCFKDHWATRTLVTVIWPCSGSTSVNSFSSPPQLGGVGSASAAVGTLPSTRKPRRRSRSLMSSHSLPHTIVKSLPCRTGKASSKTARIAGAS